MNSCYCCSSTWNGQVPWGALFYRSVGGSKFYHSGELISVFIDTLLIGFAETEIHLRDDILSFVRYNLARLQVVVNWNGGILSLQINLIRGRKSSH